MSERTWQVGASDRGDSLATLHNPTLRELRERFGPNPDFKEQPKKTSPPKEIKFAPNRQPLSSV